MSKQKVLTLDEARAAMLAAKAAYDVLDTQAARLEQRRVELVEAASEDDDAAIRRELAAVAAEVDILAAKLDKASAVVSAALLAYIASARSDTSAKIKELASERRAARQAIEDAKHRQTRAASRITGIAMVDGKLAGYAEAIQKNPGRAAALVDHAVAAVASGVK